MLNQADMKKKIEKVLKTYPIAGRDKLIPILQDVQEELGYLSKEAVIEVGKHVKIPASKIYGVATFYNHFRFKPIGKYHIQLCRGTACHVKGSSNILDALAENLEIGAGETTKDGMFSLEVVACIGACGLAPVISINGEFHAKVTPDSIVTILKSYREKGE
jgi:NADH-quinone oxidoreductase E subunit